MADRYATAIVLSIVEGERPPAWCLEALPKLPDEMKEADRRDSELDRRIIDQVESVILADKVGKTFDAVVVEVGKRGGTIQLTHPAVLAPCEGPDLPLGQPIRVRLVEADPDESRIRFEVDGS
jgi:exoribonuclease R